MKTLKTNTALVSKTANIKVGDVIAPKHTGWGHYEKGFRVVTRVSAATIWYDNVVIASSDADYTINNNMFWIIDNGSFRKSSEKRGVQMITDTNTTDYAHESSVTLD